MGKLCRGLTSSQRGVAAALAGPSMLTPIARGALAVRASEGRTATAPQTRDGWESMKPPLLPMQTRNHDGTDSHADIHTWMTHTEQPSASGPAQQHQQQLQQPQVQQPCVPAMGEYETQNMSCHDDDAAHHTTYSDASRRPHHADDTSAVRHGSSSSSSSSNTNTNNNNNIIRTRVMDGRSMYGSNISATPSNTMGALDSLVGGSTNAVLSGRGNQAATRGGMSAVKRPSRVKGNASDVLRPLAQTVPAPPPLRVGLKKTALRKPHMGSTPTICPKQGSGVHGASQPTLSLELRGTELARAPR